MDGLHCKLRLDGNLMVADIFRSNGGSGTVVASSSMVDSQKSLLSLSSSNIDIPNSTYSTTSSHSSTSVQDAKKSSRVMTSSSNDSIELLKSVVVGAYSGDRWFESLRSALSGDELSNTIIESLVIPTSVPNQQIELLDFTWSQATALRKVIDFVRRHEVRLEAAGEGENGTVFLKDDMDDRDLAIFKPIPTPKAPQIGQDDEASIEHHHSNTNKHSNDSDDDEDDGDNDDDDDDDENDDDSDNDSPHNRMFDFGTSPPLNASNSLKYLNTMVESKRAPTIASSVQRSPSSVSISKETAQSSTDVVFIPAGLQPHETALREVAAYMLDRDHAYGVPATIIARITHPDLPQPTLGALQEFVTNMGAAWDMGPQSFAVADVQRIAILDVRILNCDRHGGNILVQRVSSFANGGGVASNKLIPIDQGFSLPDHVVSDIWFEWLNWRQSRQPLSADLKRHVDEIDIEQDRRLLLRLGVRAECIRVMMASTLLLKRAVSADFSMYDIGQMLVARRVGRAPDENATGALMKSDLASLFERALEREKQQSMRNSSSVLSSASSSSSSSPTPSTAMTASGRTADVVSATGLALAEESSGATQLGSSHVVDDQMFMQSLSDLIDAEIEQQQQRRRT